MGGDGKKIDGSLERCRSHLDQNLEWPPFEQTPVCEESAFPDVYDASPGHEGLPSNRAIITSSLAQLLRDDETQGTREPLETTLPDYTPAPSIVRFILEGIEGARIREQGPSQIPYLLTRYSLERLKQWGIDVPSTKIVNDGLDAVDRIERMLELPPEKLAKVDPSLIEKDLALVRQAAREIKLVGTDFGIYPEKTLEYYLNRSHKMKRALEFVLKFEQRALELASAELRTRGIDPSVNKTELRERAERYLAEFRTQDAKIDHKLESAYRVLGNSKRAIGDASFSVFGVILGVNMTDINDKDHTYRSGDATRDTATKEAGKSYGMNIHGKGDKGEHRLASPDNVTRIKNTNVVVMCIDPEIVAREGNALVERIRNSLSARGDLPITDWSKVDINIHSYHSSLDLTLEDFKNRGTLETKLAKFISELNAGEHKAGVAKQNSGSREPFYVYEGKLTPAEVESAAKESFFLFHSPNTGQPEDLRAVEPLDAKADERPPLAITEEGIKKGELMRRAHRFGYAIALARDLGDLTHKLADAIAFGRKGEIEKLQRKIASYLAEPAPKIAPGKTYRELMADLSEQSKYNIRFSENGKEGLFVLKPQYVAEKAQELQKRLLKSFGKKAKVKLHVFFTELHKAGDYFSTYKAKLTDAGYRITLEIPLKGFAQKGMGEGVQAVMGGDEAIWIRAEVILPKDRNGMTPEKIAEVGRYISEEFARIHQNREFQPSEKVPFAGGKYKGVRFGIAADGTIYIERPKRLKKKKGKGRKRAKGTANPKALTSDVKFRTFLHKNFGIDPAEKVTFEIVRDLAKKGSVGRHKVWVDTGEKGGKKAFVYLPKGVTPEGLKPLMDTFGINMAHGETTDPRDLFYIIAKLGETVTLSKENGGDPVEAEKMSFWEKGKTRPGYRVAGSLAAWSIGSLGAKAFVGGMRALLTGDVSCFKDFLDADTYVEILKHWGLTTASAAVGDLVPRSAIHAYREHRLLSKLSGPALEALTVMSPNGRLKLRPGIVPTELSRLQKFGVHASALTAAILIPQLLSGEISAEGVLHSLGAVSAAMATSSLVLKGLRGAQLISAESGWGIVLSAVLEFTVIEGYHAILDAEMKASERDRLKMTLADSMRKLDSAIADLERSPKDEPKREAVKLAFSEYYESQKQYTGFLRLYFTEEGEELLEAVEDRDEERRQLAAGRDLKKQLTWLEGGDERGWDGDVQRNQVVDLESMYRDVAEAEEAVEAETRTMLATFQEKLNEKLAELSGKEGDLLIDAKLCDAPEPVTPEPFTLKGDNFGRTSFTVYPSKPEHPYNAQLSEDAHLFHVQSMLYSADRAVRVSAAVKEEAIAEEILLAGMPEDSPERIIYGLLRETL